MSDPSSYPVPPASFLFLVESLLMQAQMQLGLLRLGDPGDEPTEPNLPLARHSIDLLAMLQEKTSGNLSMDEKRLLENGLTELRFRYVQVAEERSKTAAAPEEPSRILTPDEDAPRIIVPGTGKGFKSN